MKTVVALQPGYLPWLGFFEQMNRCHTFIFRDDVQYTKGDWRNRNRIKSPNGPAWLTVPVQKAPSGTLIKDIRIANHTNWAAKHLNLIRNSYGQAPFFKVYFNDLERILKAKYELLIELDMMLIRYLNLALGLEREMIFASEFDFVEKGEAGLLALCKAVDATHCYNGAAGRALYSPERFREVGVTLTFQDYTHPVYSQKWGEFVPYLSVIDLLFNYGEESLSVLLSTVET